ncbi:MAG: hypothetical protein H7039_23030, partial [Bryobacteraceae bacterium]|nr:hypothetical protein [Bryobacteraceae bacterium]
MWFARTVLLLIVIGTLLLLLRYVPFALSSYAFYTAMICALVALVGFFRPLPVIWIANRSVAGIALAAAVLVAVMSLLWPPKSQRASETGTLLDHFLPKYEQREFHALRVPAAAEKSWRAVKEVTFADVPAFRILMSIRMAAVGKFRERAAPGSEAILAGIARPGSGFFVLGETPGEEIVIGMAGRPWASETSALRTPEEFVAYAAPGSVR